MTRSGARRVVFEYFRLMEPPLPGTPRGALRYLGQPGKVPCTFVADTAVIYKVSPLSAFSPLQSTHLPAADVVFPGMLTSPSCCSVARMGTKVLTAACLTCLVQSMRFPASAPAAHPPLAGPSQWGCPTAPCWEYHSCCLPCSHPFFISAQMSLLPGSLP